MIVTGNSWVDGVLIVAAVLGALSVIWRKAVRPIIRAAQKTEQTLPVVLNIAEQFRANGGNSLKDSLDTLAADAKALSEYAHSFKHDFVDKFSVLSGNQELLGERVDKMSDEVSSVKADVAEIKKIVESRAKSR